MITVNNQSLNTYLQQQESIDILNTFNESVNQHALYHHAKALHTARAPRASKPTIATGDQVFYYYLASLGRSAQRHFHSFSQMQQDTIQLKFQRTSISSSQQAIDLLTNLIKLQETSA